LSILDFPIWVSALFLELLMLVEQFREVGFVARKFCLVAKAHLGFGALAILSS
jgi:hypothetical protein